MTPERIAELRRNVRPWNSDIDVGLVECMDEIDDLRIQRDTYRNVVEKRDEEIRKLKARLAGVILGDAP